MFFGDFDGLRRQLASYKLPALVLSLMLIAVIGAVLAVRRGVDRLDLVSVLKSRE